MKQSTLGLVIMMLVSACAPPPVQRPLEGAPPVTESSLPSNGNPGAPSGSDIPPTLSPIGAPATASPTQEAAMATSPSPSPSPSPIPGYVIVATDGRGANLRDNPGLSSRVLETLPEGTAVEVFGEPVTVEGRAWRRIRSGNREGWVIAVVVRER